MFYGLQGMKSDCPEVRALLRELSRLVKTCTKRGAQAVGMMLYGSQGIKSDCPEVIALLRELPRLVKTCKERFIKKEDHDADDSRSTRPASPSS